MTTSSAASERNVGTTGARSTSKTESATKTKSTTASVYNKTKNTNNTNATVAPFTPNTKAKNHSRPKVTLRSVTRTNSNKLPSKSPRTLEMTRNHRDRSTAVAVRKEQRFDDGHREEEEAVRIRFGPDKTSSCAAT